MAKISDDFDPNLILDIQKKNQEIKKNRIEAIRKTKKQVGDVQFLRDMFKIMEDEKNTDDLFELVKFAPHERKIEDGDEIDEIRQLPAYYYGLE